MADAKTPSQKDDKNRRSGLDRRWIIAPHEGPKGAVVTIEGKHWKMEI